jgi:hypothetical protein
MASGDRKVKLMQIIIGRANPVPYFAEYQFFIQNNQGVDVYAGGGSVSGNLGTPAVAGAKTLSQIQTEVLTAISAHPSTPPNDSVS